MTYRFFTFIAICFLGWFQMQAQAVPFKLVGKSILIQATVNNVTGYFILDTGTPHLILNNRYFKGLPTGKKFVGLVGKQIDILKNEVKLSMGSHTWNRIEAMILPLDHLSSSKGLTIMGLIGNNALRHFEVSLDFDTQQIELMKASKRATSVGKAYFANVSFRFLWRGGIPVIKAQLGETPLFFGFDTGAGINALNKERADGLADHLSVNHKVKVTGMGEGRKTLESGLIHDLSVDNYNCPAMQVVLVSMHHFKGFDSQLNSIDGFLGYEFLQHFRTVINFRKRTISLYYRNDFAKTYLVAR